MYFSKEVNGSALLIFRESLPLELSSFKNNYEYNAFSLKKFILVVKSPFLEKLNGATCSTAPDTLASGQVFRLQIFNPMKVI
jgi:hypothetical protein